MTAVSTFYLSRILGNRIINDQKETVGKLKDIYVDTSYIRPRIVAVSIREDHKERVVDYEKFTILKEKGQYVLKCSELNDIVLLEDNILSLKKNVMDRQIVDMDGRKVVRVNDLRLAILSNGTYAVAVDVGVEGLLRRLGVAKPVKKIIKPFGLTIPSKMILWDEVATIDFTHSGIRLSKEYSKLSTLHPSDLADIIEDLDSNTQIAIFASLDEEKAADVLEELETEAQLNVLESMTIEKAADVLEKMPADEVADILDEMEDEKAEELLDEMESEASEEVRELMEYDEDTVGSLMTTDYISFNENATIDMTINELRKLKPESDTIYYLYVLDDDERLVATVSLRDIVISEPDVMLKQIMNEKIIFVYDDDQIDSLAEIVSKYSLLAIPVVDKEMRMLGMVIIDDIIHTLIRSKRRRA